MTLRLVIAAVLAVLLAGSHWKAYVMGKDVVRAEWSADKLAAEIQAENNRMLAQANVNKAGKAFAEKAAKSRVIVQTKIVEVEKYVPSTLPLLPGDFRLFHDAAAAGEEIDDSRRIASAPVAPSHVARTVAENYASANYDKQRLEAIQQIIRASGCFDISEE